MASTPNTPSVNNPSTQGVLIPTKDLILINESEMSIEIMTDLVFEDIGGQELISFLRHNNVNGLNVEYIPIKYLSRLDDEYNPNRILALQTSSTKYLDGFKIRLEDKIPDGAHVYIEEETGDLIIELKNLDEDENVEVKMALSGTIYRDEV